MLKKENSLEGVNKVENITKDLCNNEKQCLIKSKNLIEKKVKELRNKTPNICFARNKIAELEVNKFFYKNSIVDRAMIVLRANGCEHYKKNGGCTMCSHFNGTDRNVNITTQDYINQWNSVHDCKTKNGEAFNINNYPVVCVYNLGSLLNENEISAEAVQYIFNSLNNFQSVEKVIIESRAEYISAKALQNIKDVYKNGIVEVGIGIESTNVLIREVCHHKGLEDLQLAKQAIVLLHQFGFKALAYVNFKPIFLTEQEAINDAISTIVDCFKMGFDAVSIEPTSLQDYSLANHLNLLGLYRVPWLWSLQSIVKGVYDQLQTKTLDIRIGGYFDEEVLSGSQGEGFCGKNELFPHQTSSNCQHCSPKFIENIKKFNMTYDIKDLNSIEKCPFCYNLWQDACRVKDSRSIYQRIHDALQCEENDE